MSKTPLQVYKEVVKEFSVKDDYTVSPVGKMTYVQEQVQQQRAIINRLLFDLATSRIHMESAEDKLSKSAHRKKAESYADDLVQLLGSVKINLEFIEELRKEYSELQIEE